MSTFPFTYRKRFAIFRNPAIRAEIDALDAQQDCQRIVHLLACYEFPFDITRCLELALFHTYASRSVSRLLEATREFKNHGQKRYDDTRLLISHFLEDGYDSEYGRRAINRMNAIHGVFRIPNDDYLFVLSTFISYPFDWLEKYGYRPLTPHEKLAWFHFFREVGRRMHIEGIPDNWDAFRQWVDGYEAAHLVYAQSNRSVADATIGIFKAWFPKPLRGLVEPVVRCLISDKLRRAFGYEAPPMALVAIVRAGLRVRKRFMKLINIERHPKLIANTLNRTYPENTYAIDDIAPSYMHRRIGKRNVR
jgi:hypothetical protein